MFPESLIVIVGIRVGDDVDHMSQLSQPDKNFCLWPGGAYRTVITDHQDFESVFVFCHFRRGKISELCFPKQQPKGGRCNELKPVTIHHLTESWVDIFKP